LILFLDIIDNIININTKSTLSLYNEINSSELKKRVKVKKRYAKYNQKKPETPKEIFMNISFSEDVFKYFKAHSQQ